MSSNQTTQNSNGATKKRLSKEARNRQLIDVAWSIVREEGTDALTLGYLAERAEIAKPVVYDHFGTRTGLLGILYKEYDSRQHANMDEALLACPKTLPAVAQVIGSTYIKCAIQMGHEMPGINAALAGSPELGALKKEHDVLFLEKCQNVLEPFAQKPLTPAAMRAILGAAEALSFAAAAEELDPADALGEICDVIIQITSRV